MAYPLITLTTDFGHRDPYVGVMHGVIHGRCPQAKVIDLTHEIPAQDIHAAGFAMRSAWRYFPGGTVHVCVVDPGVGSERKIVAAQMDGHYFLAPDNGVLNIVLDTVTPPKLINVIKREFFLKSISHTFHGRDIFSPVAAALARGIPMDDLGDPLEAIQSAGWAEPVIEEGKASGEVIYEDHFGNLITNIPGTQMPFRPVISLSDGRAIQPVKTYMDVAEGELCALIGSSGYLELAVNHGSAKEHLQRGVGLAVNVVSEIY